MRVSGFYRMPKMGKFFTGFGILKVHGTQYQNNLKTVQFYSHAARGLWPSLLNPVVVDVVDMVFSHIHHTHPIV